MTCPDETTRSLHLDGELSAEKSARVEAHLSACPRCAREYRVLDRIGRILAVDDSEALPSGLLDRVRRIPDGSGGNRRRLAVPLAAAAAAVVLAALLTGIGGEGPGPPRAGAPATHRDLVIAALLEPGPRSAASSALLGDSALVLLHRIALCDRSDAGRAALRRIGELRRRESLPTLLAAVEMADRSTEAVEALAALDDERALTALAPLIEGEAPDDAAITAIARIGGERAVALLARRLPHANGSEEAYRLLGLLVMADVRSAARRLLELAEDPDLSGPVFATMRASEAALLPHLLDLACGPDDATARRAIDAVARLAPPSAVQILGTLLGDRHRRASAAEALAKIDNPEAAAFLARHGTSDEVRRAIRKAGPGIESWLIERLESGDLSARLRAVDLLGLCGGPRAVPALVPLASEPALTPGVLRTLREIGGDEAVASLGRLAEEPRLRRVAFETLAETGEAEAVRTLVRLGTAPGRKALRKALRSLESMDRELVVPILTRLAAESPGSGASRILARMQPAPGATSTRWSAIR